eukprot:3703016-Pleurochrysis_carterae.AAC.1
MAAESEHAAELIVAIGGKEDNAELREWVLRNIIRAKAGTSVAMKVSTKLAIAESCGLNVMQDILSAPYVHCQVAKTSDG